MVKKIIFRNFFSLSSGQIFSQGLTFLTLIYLARVIGPEGLGKIGFAQVFTSYFMNLTDMGLGHLGIREIARDKNKINYYVNTILSIKISLAAILFILLIGITLFINKPSDIKILILIYGLGIFLFAAALDWFFLGIERMGLTGVVNSLKTLIFLLLILIFVKGDEDIFKVALFFIISFFIATIFYYILANKYFSYSFRFKINFNEWKNVIIEALPISILIILSIFTQQQSILVLGFFNSSEEVGLYYGIYKIIFIVLFIIGLYGDSIYPILSYEKGHQIVLFSLKLIFLTVVPVVILLNVFTGQIITLVMGEKFINGTLIFKILIWSIPLMAFMTVFSKALIAKRHARECLIANLGGFLTSVVTSLYLVPLYGLTGAAASYIISMIIVVIYMGYYTLKIARYSVEVPG